MTTIEKAAQEAVAEIVPHLENINCRLNAYGKDQLRVIITKHLAPVQAELDAKDKLLSEAQWILQGLHAQCECSLGTPTKNPKTCAVCARQDWLARVKG